MEGIYVEGEEVQIAVTLTAPKAKVSFNNDSNAPVAAVVGAAILQRQ